MTSIEGVAPLRPRPIRPVYIFAKPPSDVARRIACLRRLLGIDADYAADRFHVTLLRLGEYDALSERELLLIERTVARLHVDPVRIAFHRSSGNCLRGKGLHGLKALQSTLAASLVCAGVRLPEYAFDPHLTLAYRSPLRPAATFTPIEWLADELSLVVSHYGQGRHEQLCRWHLLPRQFAFAV